MLKKEAILLLVVLSIGNLFIQSSFGEEVQKRSFPDQYDPNFIPPLNQQLLSHIQSVDTVSIPYFENFEGSENGWTSDGFYHLKENPQTLQVLNPTINPRLVHLPDDGFLPHPNSGNGLCWYGEDATGTFIGSDFNPDQDSLSGGTSLAENSGSLVSPTIDLTSATNAVLEFFTWWEIEGVDADRFDIMHVEISTDGGSNFDSLGNLNPLNDLNGESYVAFTNSGLGEPAQWKKQIYDLSAYVGNNVNLRFRFETRDQLYNGFRGWFIDDVAVTGEEILSPDIVSIIPDTGIVESMFEINGDNFVDGAKIYFESFQIASSVLSHQNIQCQVPDLAIATYDVIVENPNGLADTLFSGFTITTTQPPTVSSITPSECDIDESVLVTISGSNFIEGLTAEVSGISLGSIDFGSFTSISGYTSNDLAAGTHNVKVINPDGQYGLLVDAFIVHQADNPNISVSPSSFNEELQIGETSTQIMTIINTGNDTLDYGISIYETSALSSPNLKGVTLVDRSDFGKKHSFKNNGYDISTMKQSTFVAYQDLKASQSSDGGNILWDITQGVYNDREPSGYFSSLTSLLNSAGYNVMTTDAGVDNVDLSTYGVLVICLGSAWNSSYTTSEIDAISQFVNQGGGLLILGDNPNCPNENVNPLSEEFGISLGVSSIDPGDLYFSNFSSLEIFDGINEIYYRAAGEITVTTLAIIEAFTPEGKGVIASNVFHPGRVLALGDYNCWGNEYITNVDNQAFAENVFNWLSQTNSSIDWLSCDSYSGTVQAGSSQDIEVTFDAAGLSPDEYTAIINITSNDPDESLVTIPANLTVNGGNTTLSGHVTDATTGNPIEGATVCLGSICDETDSDGLYLLENVPPGELTANFMGTPRTGDSPLTVQFTDLSTNNTQTVTSVASGYIDYINEQVQIIENESNVFDISMSPEITGNELRFVLTWDDDPADLDSHLKTPDIEGQQYHVYYSAPGSSTQPPYAVLDVDDVTGWGPETITIVESYPGTYNYYIYKFSGNEEIIQSNANVSIYDDAGLIQSLNVPTSGEGRYWYICDIDGVTQNITLVNEIRETEPGFVTAIQYADKPKSVGKELIQSSNITSWEWDFGDGNTSTDQNPSHIYEVSGYYDVFLTVSDGTNENTETKVDYISVGSSNEITLTIGDTEGHAGNVVSIPVVVSSGFTDVAMLELHISYCSDLLSYTGMSSESGLISDDINDMGDYLNIVWVYSGTPMEVSAGDTLIMLNFDINITGTIGQTCMLEFIGENNIGSSAENVYELTLNAGTFTIIGCTISGRISYCETDVFIENATVVMSGDMQTTVTTNSTGDYLFDEIQGNVTITSTKDNDSTEINGNDLLRLKNILLEIHTPTECELWAADCNGTTPVNGFDLLRLKKFLLGLEVDPPIATWGFDPGDYSYSPIIDDMADQNFVAILFGDVNLSWGSTSSTALAKAANGGKMAVGNYYFDETGNIHLPVYSNMELSIGMLDWCIEYDTTLFTFKSIESRFLESGDYRSSEGQVKIVWVYSGEDEKFSKDEVICTLVLQPKEAQGSGIVSFAGDNYMSKGDETPYDLAYGDVEVNLNVLSLFEEGVLPTETTLYPNYPNPFNPTTTISYYLSQASDVEIKIFNIRGETKKAYTFATQSAGFYQVEWNTLDANGSAVPSGIYFYRLRCGDQVHTKRMLLMK